MFVFYRWDGELKEKKVRNNFVFFSQSLDQWQAVFWVSAAMYLGTWLFYVVFASSDIQPWNSDGGEREKGVNGVENNLGEEELESLNKTKDEA